MISHTRKKTSYACLAALFLCMRMEVAAAQPAQVGASLHFGGHEYRLYAYQLNDDRSWGSARVFAAGVGGHLVSINSAAENQFLVDNFTLPSLPGNRSGGWDQTVWTGGTDRISEGTWVWDGDPAAGVFWNGGPASAGGSAPAGQFSSWIASEPNNYPDEDHLVLVLQGAQIFSVAGTWYDLPPWPIGFDGPVGGFIVEFRGDPHCTPTPANLIAWSPGEGAANDIIGGHHGQLLGGASFGAGKVGQSFSFDSDDDRVTIPHDPALNVNSPGFTVECWIRGLKNQPQGLYLVVDKSHGLGGQTGWGLQGFSSTGEIAFFIGSGVDFPGVIGSDVLDGIFHHVAGTWDGATIRLYVDGFLQGSTPLTTPVNNTGAMNIGWWWGGGTPNRFFRGKVDELSLYSRAPTEAEIHAIFYAGSAGKCQDDSPPVTTATLSGVQGLNDWYVGDVSVTLNAVDTGSGVKEIVYSLDGGATNTVVAGDVATLLATTECETTITFYARDNDGNTEAPQTLAIRLDKTPPTVSCPPNTTVGNDPGRCDAALNPGVASASDNCGAPSLASSRSDGLALDAPYPVGTTIITWTATDTAGNTAVCEQTITVNDVEAPTLNLPANLIVYQDSAFGATVNYTVTARDNCDSSVTLICSPPSGSVFLLGTTTVNCTATDDAGNTTSGSFTVTVVTPPSTASAKVTGGGSINVAGGTATFGMVEITNAAGQPKGNLTYQDHVTGMTLKSIKVTSLVINGTHATIFLKATINGTGEYDVRVAVDDLGEPGGGVDRFSIQVSNGYAAGGTVLEGGNVQIHP